MFLLASMVPWTTFKIHRSFPFHKRFFIVEKGLQKFLHTRKKVFLGNQKCSWHRYENPLMGPLSVGVLVWMGLVLVEVDYVGLSVSAADPTSLDLHEQVQSKNTSCKGCALAERKLHNTHTHFCWPAMWPAEWEMENNRRQAVDVNLGA